MLYLHSLILLIAVIMQQYGCLANLFCNANFQNYSLSQTITLFSYSLIYNFMPPDACWYPIGTSNFHVKEVGYYPNNQLCELVQLINRYKLCHNLTLTHNNTYQYSFDTGAHPNVNVSSINIYVNSTKINALKIQQIAAPTLTHVNSSFIANATGISSFCIQSASQTLKNAFFFTLDHQATFVDNIYMVGIVANTTTTNTTASATTSNTTTNTTSNVTTNTTSSNTTSNSTTTNTTNNTTSNTTNTTITSNITNSTINSTSTLTPTTNTTLNTTSQPTANISINNTTTPTSNNITINNTTPSTTTPADNTNTNTNVTKMCMQYYTDFNTAIDDRNNIVSVQSVQKFGIYAPSLLENSSLVIQNQVITNVQYFSTTEGYLVLQAHLDKAYNIKDMVLNIHNKIQTADFCYFVKARILHTTVLFMPLTEQQAQIIQYTQNISTSVMGFLFNNYGNVRFFFFSYFVANFISFFNVIILFNFLNLQTQSSFSYLTLKQLADLYFNSNYNILQMIMSTMNKVNIQILDFINNLADTSGSNQRIQKKVDNFQWFNDLGISYNYMLSNISNIISVVLLFCKILIFVLVRKLIRIYSKNLLRKNKNIYVIILSEMLCNSSVICISSVQTIIKPGCQKFNEIINYSLQVLSFIMLLMLPFCCSLVLTQSYSKRKANNLNKKYLNNDNNNNSKGYQNSYDNHLRFKWKSYFQQVQNSFIILIPCLLVLRNKIAFFIVTTIPILILLYIYFKGFSYFTIFRKIHYGLIILVLLSHHSSFFLLFIFSVLNQDTQLKYIFAIKIVSIIVIFTVLSGSLIELVEALISILINLFGFLKYIVKKLCNRPVKKTIPNPHSSNLFTQDNNKSTDVQTLNQSPFQTSMHVPVIRVKSIIPNPKRVPEPNGLRRKSSKKKTSQSTSQDSARTKIILKVRTNHNSIRINVLSNFAKKSQSEVFDSQNQ